jgi:hypothetical protein
MINNEKEIICSSDNYRIVKFRNKYIVEEKKTFMKLWVIVKSYTFLSDKREESAKQGAYDFYIKLINK